LATFELGASFPVSGIIGHVRRHLSVVKKAGSYLVETNPNVLFDGTKTSPEAQSETHTLFARFFKNKLASRSLKPSFPEALAKPPLIKVIFVGGQVVVQ
jgi:hypothetical protein